MPTLPPPVATPDDPTQRRYPGARVALAHLVQAYPGLTGALVGALLLSGLFEGLGIATLLPFLRIFLAAGDPAEGSALARAIGQVFQWLGIELTLYSALGAMVAVILAKAACLYVAMRLIAHASSAITADLRRQLLRAELGARWSYLVRRRPGEVAAAISSESNKIGDIYVQICRGLALGIKAGTYLVLAFLLSWQMTGAALVLGVISFYFLFPFVRRSRDAGRDSTNLQARFLNRLLDTLGGIKAVRAMGAEGPLTELLDQDIDRWREAHFWGLHSIQTVDVLHEPIRVLAISVVLVLLPAGWLQSPEQLMVLALLFLRIYAEIGTLQSIYQRVASSSPSYFFVTDRIRTAAEDREDLHGGAAPTLDQGLEVARVSFSYGEAPVLEEVDLEVPAGQVVVLVGASGGGKSTLADLVLGLLEPDAGAVLVDGTPLTELDLGAWRAGIGLVPQESMMLHDTVRVNLTLGDERFSDEVLRAALEKAGALEFVDALPEGLDANVGERGERLSGGQRQRLAIARALCRSPRLLVLDEATSALDPETELQICEAVAALRGEVTVLAISHQEAIARYADRVYRVQGGRVQRVEEDGAAASA